MELIPQATSIFEKTNSVKTLQRGFLAKSGEERSEVANYEIGLSAFFMVLLAFFSARDATTLFESHHETHKKEKIRGFDSIEKNLIGAPIAENSDGSRIIVLGKFKLIENLKNEKRVITIMDVTNGEWLELPPGYSLDDLKLKALIYTAASKIISAEINDDGNCRTISLDKFTPFTLTENKNEDGKPVITILDRTNATESTLSPGITLDELKLEALLSIAANEIIYSDIDDHKTLSFEGFTMTEEQENDEPFITVSNTTNGAPVRLPKITLRDLKLRALDTLSAEEKAAMIFGIDSADDPNSQITKNELAALYCTYGKFKAASKFDKDSYGGRLLGCVEYLKKNYDQVMILDGIYPIKADSQVERAMKKMKYYADYCNKEVKKSHASKNPVFEHLYAEASSAGSTLYYALFQLNDKKGRPDVVSLK